MKIQDEAGEWVEALALLAKQVRNGNLHLYLYAASYHALISKPDADHNQIANSVREKYGVEIHSKSASSKLRTVHRAYRLAHGFTTEELEDFSPYILYDLQRLVDIPGSSKDTVKKWLDKARALNREELLALAAGGVMPGEVKHFKLSAEIAAMIDAARDRMESSIGLPLSQAQYHEFWANIVLSTRPEELRDLYYREHGMSRGDAA